MSKSPQILNKQEEVSESHNENPFDESNSEVAKKEKKEKKENRKKMKKIKKEKKSKKLGKEKKKNKKRQDESDFDDDQDDKNSMFDDEAESGQEDYDDEQYEAEIGYEEQKQHYETLYKRPNATERLMERLQGKTDKEINAQFSKRAYMIKQQEELFPSDKDPKLFIVQVKPRAEEELVLCILNKAKFLARKNQKMNIISVIALKKKYPGKLLIEAYSERDVYESLQGFNNIFLGKKIVKLDNDGYIGLFNRIAEENIQFQEGSYVRIKKGLYEGDLAKIFKVKKTTIDVLLVPRINIQQIIRKIRDQTSGIMDEEKQKLKKEELLKLFIDHKINNFRERPAKRQLFAEDFNDLKQVPGIKNIRLANMNGLILLSYHEDELSKVHGTYLPVEIMPFTTEGNFMDEIKEQGINMATSVNFKIGEQVEIIAGELEKHYGILIEIRDKIGVMKCKNKEMKGQILEEPLEHLAKKFKQGQKVKVISGVDTGKTGIILSVLTKEVQIWTDNSNSIKVNKKNLTQNTGQTICKQNVHGLKKDDLIKTNKNLVGIVIETTKDNIKVIDTGNILQVVSNMDFDQKITIRHLVAKNKSGDEIKEGALIVIRNGVNQGKRCRVIHVYRQFVFLFNESFIRSCGICVESTDNCSIISKNDTGRVSLTTRKPPGNADETFDQSEEITVGMAFTLKSGPLKGYKGIVKSINKEKIQVRVLSKACTEWVSRKSLVANQIEVNEQQGKTPSRVIGSYRGFDQPSPNPNYD